MATILSTPTTITVGAAGASLLSSVAAQMARGTWAQVAGVRNQDSVLFQVGLAATPVIVYCNSMPWNGVSKRIEGIGQGHGAGAFRYWQYADANATFSTVWEDLATTFPGFSPGHGYDHAEINPYTGDLYVRDYTAGTSALHFWKKPNNSNNFSRLPDIRPVDIAYEGVAGGLCWANAGFLGSGAQGCLLAYCCGDSGSNAAKFGTIVAWDPVANSWFFNRSGASPNGAGNLYHEIAEFSPGKNVAVYGGGNGQENKLWSMDAAGNVTQLTTSPVPLGAGEAGQGRFVCEPASGNFLALYGGQLWELNPSGTGTWTRLADPPSGVSSPSATTSTGRCIFVSIPDYGVVAAISQQNSSGGTFFLYKR